MLKLNHSAKVRLARKMQTPAELKAKVPIFQTKGWFQRSLDIFKRVNNKIKSI